MNETRIKIDPHLLTYIYKSLNYYPATLYDFSKITQLNCDGMISPLNFYYENVPYFIEICDGAWDVIGEMKRLKKLTVSRIELPDFSFLSKCARLEKLELISTNFSDCRLLLNLPNLKRLTLENSDLLTNREVLSGLACQIDEIWWEPEPEEIPEPGEELSDQNDYEGVSVRYLSCTIYENGRLYTFEYGIKMQKKITEEVLREVSRWILQGKLYRFLASDEEYGESGWCLAADMSGGRLSFTAGNMFDNEPPYYYYHNPRYPKQADYSLADIADPSSIPIELFCDDPAEAVEIIQFFIKTGKLYPMAEWYKYSD